MQTNAAAVRMVWGEDVRVGQRVDLGAMFAGNPPEVRRVERLEGRLIAIHFEAGGVGFHHLARPDDRVRVVEPSGSDPAGRVAVVGSGDGRERAARSPRIGRGLSPLGTGRGLAVDVVTPGTRRDRVAERIAAFPDAVRLEVAVSPEFDEALDAMAGELGITREEVIRRAVSLYRVATRGWRGGKQLLLADAEGEQEIR